MYITWLSAQILKHHAQTTCQLKNYLLFNHLKISKYDFFLRLILLYVWPNKPTYIPCIDRASFWVSWRPRACLVASAAWTRRTGYCSLLSVATWPAQHRCRKWFCSSLERLLSAISYAAILLYVLITTVCGLMLGFSWHYGISRGQSVLSHTIDRFSRG